MTTNDVNKPYKGRGKPMAPICQIISFTDQSQGQKETPIRKVINLTDQSQVKIKNKIFFYFFAYNNKKANRNTTIAIVWKLIL